MFEEYGVTHTGFVAKRLDVIIDEIHGDLTEKWGVNTRQNPQSLLNVLVTNFADCIAELWETGQEVYNAMYPFSAEGLSLDNAVQYGGVYREEARPAVYPVLCECVDGTVIPRGTRIRTSTNPAVHFSAGRDTVVTRNAFNRARIRAAVVTPGTVYTIALNGGIYSYTGGAADTEQDILGALAAAVTDTDFNVTAESGVLSVQSVSLQSSHALTLSATLTTVSIAGLVNFASETNGDTVLPHGVITEIVTAVPGLISVVNLAPHIAGRLRQDDAGLRQSYADKIFARSDRMIESIRSAILLNVQGVTGAVGYQNDTSVEDAYGRWPHSVEMVVDGGSDYEIARQIWDKKAAGIQTFGSTEVIVPGNEGEQITVRFNRPEYVYIWFRVVITMNPAEILPPNYVEAIKEIIVRQMAAADPGKPIIPQRLIEFHIYSNVSGIMHLDTATFSSADPGKQPTEYATGAVPVTPRQRAVTDGTRIEVILGG